MTIDNLLNWLQEAEDNNSFMVSTQSVKRHLEKIQKEQLNLYGVVNQRELLFCGGCGDKRQLIVETDINSQRACKNKLCKQNNCNKLNYMKKYNIIYADPAWNFGNRMYSSNKNDHHREITRAYDVMNTKDIANIPIKDITEDDAICFMWTTDAHIPDAIEVMKAWGFKYKTVAFIWNKKEKSGKQVCFMGQWTMKGSEIVLLGTKGKMTQHLKSRKVRQLVEAGRERTIHSRKPQIIRDKIVEMFGNDLPKLELFARIKVDGWDSWGNEIESDVNFNCFEIAKERGQKKRKEKE